MCAALHPGTRKVLKTKFLTVAPANLAQLLGYVRTQRESLLSQIVDITMISMLPFDCFPYSHFQGMG